MLRYLHNLTYLLIKYLLFIHRNKIKAFGIVETLQTLLSKGQSQHNQLCNKSKLYATRNTRGQE